MTIRPLHDGDETGWLRLRRRLEMAELRRDPARSSVFVLERQPGRLGGYAEVMLREGVDGARQETTAYLEGWFVEADLRARGWGGRLLAAVETWARAHGSLELASDAEIDDPAAIAAHRALGFRETFRIVQFLKPARRRQSPAPGKKRR